MSYAKSGIHQAFNEMNLVYTGKELVERAEAHMTTMGDVKVSFDESSTGAVVMALYPVIDAGDPDDMEFARELQWDVLRMYKEGSDIPSDPRGCRSHRCSRVTRRREIPPSVGYAQRIIFGPMNI